MAARNGRRGFDYARLTKIGVLAGVAAFAVGAAGEIGLRALGELTPTADAVFLSLEFAGPVVAVLSVFIFGIALPLTE